MSEIELAKKYMEIFFESKDFDSLNSLFDKHLDFQGPLYKFNSSADYIESLKASPPVDVDYELIEAFCNSGSACLLYRFKKQAKSTLMAQTFWFAGGRINKIRLVFNPEEIS